jgi:hypothetical protein
MGGDLGAQRGVLGGGDLRRAGGARQGPHVAARAPPRDPAAHGAGADAEPIHEISRRPPGVHGGEDSFTEIA